VRGPAPTALVQQETGRTGEPGALGANPSMNRDEAPSPRAARVRKDTQMSHIFVLKTNHQPLNPVHPGEACLWFPQRTAALWRRFPFTLSVTSAVRAPLIEPLRDSQTTRRTVLPDSSGQVRTGDCDRFPKGKPGQGGSVIGVCAEDRGRLLVQASGFIDIVTRTGRVAGLSGPACRVIQRGEGGRSA